MKPLLIVTNPRAIPDCMQAFAALTVDVAYLRAMPLKHACDAANRVIDQHPEYTHALICADDCIVTQFAVDAVTDALAAGHPAVTGWCRLDRTHTLANLTSEPLRGGAPTVESYTFTPVGDILDGPELAITHFMGMSLTGMSRDMWQRFPLGCYGTERAGWSSDFHLSARLRDAGVPMLAARDGYVDHVKEVWMRADRAPDKALLVGRRNPEVVWQHAPKKAAA